MEKTNYIWPKEYSKDGETRYSLPRGGEAMGLEEIDKIYEISKASGGRDKKDGQIWIQFFNTGYRVTSENIDYSKWSGYINSDIDSKIYYKHCKKFDTKSLYNKILNYVKTNHIDNFCSLQFSNSETGYHIIWFFSCEKNETNFKKCCNLAFKWTRECFLSIGAGDIIDYTFNGHKVLDTCTSSVYQGCYISNKPMAFGNLTADTFGQVDIEAVKIEDTFVNIMDKGDRSYEFKQKTDVDKEDIPHLNHYQRRYAYEALIEIFHEKDKVDKEWKAICGLMKEGSHDKSFYEKEPDKNKWFDRYDANIPHEVRILKKFGYEFTCSTDYVYQEGFTKAWRSYLKNEAMKLYLSSSTGKTEWINTFNEMKENLAKQLGTTKDKLGKNDTKDIEKKANSHFMAKLENTSLFDKIYDNLGHDIGLLGEDIDLDKEMEDLRMKWKQDRWDYKKWFNCLVKPYDKAKDLTAYKMFADVHYRDERNNSLIKYDILEDDILVYSYWFNTGRFQWHTFKNNDEFTTWCNNDEYSNTMTKDKMRDAVGKYAKRWFSFHTIKEYLNGLDLSKANEELLETWAIRYFNADDTQLTRTISKNFFIAAVKKQMIDDDDLTKFVFQHILFLHGKTGCGKTAFLVTMFTLNGKSYILNKIDPDAEDSKIGPLIAKNWMIQFGENGKLGKVDVNTAKEFIDRINLGMKFQKKYENEQTTVYPRVVVSRTTNDDTLFNDISVNVDRRNWIIECKVPEGYWNDTLQHKLEAEKDILWATAYKLYLDDPDKSLELPNELFNELGKVQEKHKLINNDFIAELYDALFDRYYMTNGKGEIIDEFTFLKMLERSDLVVDTVVPNRPTTYVSDIIDVDTFSQRQKINRIPAIWITNYVKNKHNNSVMKLLKDYMTLNGWSYKVCKYNGKTIKCFAKEF